MRRNKGRRGSWDNMVGCEKHFRDAIYTVFSSTGITVLDLITSLIRSKLSIPLSHIVHINYQSYHH